MRLGLVSGQPPIEIRLAAARIQADCDADGCSGKFGGGIPETEVDTLIIPAMAARMQAVIDASSCGPTSPGSCTGLPGQILGLFDANGDFKVTADEVRANFLVMAVLAPDLDLLDAKGRPGQDGIRDSLSLGLGFTSKNCHLRRGTKEH